MHDLIAQGLSPLDPPRRRRGRGKSIVARGQSSRSRPSDFAFETTLSGLSYARQLKAWEADGYAIEIAYLRLKFAHTGAP
jgi:predicted ABC-type ATPase